MPLRPSKPGIADRLRWGMIPDDIHHVAFRAVNAVQDASPDSQVHALAAAFRALSLAVGVDPAVVLETLNRADKDINNVYKPQFDALRDYARGEWT
jgi:hypothetical protein